MAEGPENGDIDRPRGQTPIIPHFLGGVGGAYLGF